MEKVKGYVKLSSNLQQIMVQATGRPMKWRTGQAGNGGRLVVKVAVDLAKQAWDVKVKGCNLFAPVSLPENLCSCGSWLLSIVHCC